MKYTHISDSVTYYDNFNKWSPFEPGWLTICWPVLLEIILTPAADHTLTYTTEHNFLSRCLTTRRPLLLVPFSCQWPTIIWHIPLIHTTGNTLTSTTGCPWIIISINFYYPLPCNQVNILWLILLIHMTGYTLTYTTWYHSQSNGWLYDDLYYWFIFN